MPQIAGIRPGVQSTAIHSPRVTPQVFTFVGAFCQTDFWPLLFEVTSQGIFDMADDNRGVKSFLWVLARRVFGRLVMLCLVILVMKMSYWHIMCTNSDDL